MIVGLITVVLLHCTVELVGFLRFEVATSTGRSAVCKADLTDTIGVLARVLPNSSTIASDFFLSHICLLLACAKMELRATSDEQKCEVMRTNNEQRKNMEKCLPKETCSQ